MGKFDSSVHSSGSLVRKRIDSEAGILSGDLLEWKINTSHVSRI